MKAFLTIDEAASYLNLSKQTIYNLSHEGKLKKLKPNGGKVYFLKSGLDKYIMGDDVHICNQMD